MPPVNPMTVMLIGETVTPDAGRGQTAAIVLFKDRIGPHWSDNGPLLDAWLRG
jgi:hypothetical protein